MLREMPAPKFIEIGQPVVTPPAPPADLNWQRVEEFLRVRELATNTKKAYERQLQQFSDWVQKPWQQITHRDIDRYKQYLKGLPSKRGGSLSPATINQSINSLKSYFKWLTVKDYIPRNPTLTIEQVKEPPMPPKDLPQPEFDALFDALSYRGESEVRDLAILQVLSHGLRAGEVSKLNTEDYDGRRLDVLDAKWGSDGKVPLKPEAIAALDAYLGWKMRQGFSIAPDAPIFISLSNNSKGQRLGYRGVYDLIKDLAKVSELEGVHPHRLRHTCATALVMAGMDTMLAKRMVRISSDRVFARYSDRALDVKMEEAFNEIYGQAQTGDPNCKLHTHISCQH
ncbi:MAG: integrase [Leptolyngbya foveolarum]|uniref:Integrase n=1 Tax=Leptolyngbya foveolarum TaxID=47253 RepID=A0A2W4U1S8_9CYAN|nr:MAG: integrase [Leptolyngbya foveolarum]